MISVLLSAFNESSNPYFWKTIELVHALFSSGVTIELIIGVTPGIDDTIDRLKNSKAKTVVCHTSQRSQRYNLALKESCANENDWIVLHHPRSLLDGEAFLSLLDLKPNIQWGAFTHKFDFDHKLLKFTSWWSNNVRGDIKHIYYLDHCIFVRRSFLEKVGGVPNVEIFEDTILSKKLRTFSSPVRLPSKSTTSATRFEKNGIWTQAIKNQILKLQFFMGESDTKMNESYEKGLNLNK